MAFLDIILYLVAGVGIILCIIYWFAIIKFLAYTRNELGRTADLRELDRISACSKDSLSADINCWIHKLTWDIIYHMDKILSAKGFHLFITISVPLFYFFAGFFLNFALVPHYGWFNWWYLLVPLAALILVHLLCLPLYGYTLFKWLTVRRKRQKFKKHLNQIKRVRLKRIDMLTDHIAKDLNISALGQLLVLVDTENASACVNEYLENNIENMDSNDISSLFDVLTDKDTSWSLRFVVAYAISEIAKRRPSLLYSEMKKIYRETMRKACHVDVPAYHLDTHTDVVDDRFGDRDEGSSSNVPHSDMYRDYPEF